MRRNRLFPCLILAASMFAGPAYADGSGPKFKPSELPPAETEGPPQSTLYEVFATSNTSPLGSNVDSVKPADLFDEAASFELGLNGHPANAAEAMFWLKRAIAVGPSVDRGQKRAWALGQLGYLLYDAGVNNLSSHGVSRQLWELAGAWKDPSALCYLGQLYESGDDVTKPDLKRALAWYEQAKTAGCKDASDAVARLHR